MAIFKQSRVRIRRIAFSEVAAAAATTRGNRFTARYQRRAHLRRSHPSRIFRLGLAISLFAVGMANVFVPGPGGSIFIFGSALVLSGESRRFAAFLDRSEVRMEKQVDWMLRHPILVGTTISIAVILVTVLVAKMLA